MKLPDFFEKTQEGEGERFPQRLWMAISESVSDLSLTALAKKDHEK